MSKSTVKEKIEFKELLKIALCVYTTNIRKRNLGTQQVHVTK